MYWVTFIISGFIVASIPWIASHFSNRIAGYIVMVPVMMTISMTVMYFSNGSKETIEMIQGMLWGLFALLIFGLIAIVALKNDVALPLALTLSLAGWLISLIIINNLVAKA